MNAVSVLVAIFCCVALDISQVKAQCPDNATLQAEAAKAVAMFFKEEADEVKAVLDALLETKRMAHDALSVCYGEYESAKNLKLARVGLAGKLAKEVSRLETRKASTKAAFDKALRDFNAAKGPQAHTSNGAHTARQQANAALKVAQQRSRAAAQAWAEANAAQQSTKWVPATNVKGNVRVKTPHGMGTPTAYDSGWNNHGQPNGGNGGRDATKLAEIAKAAEYAAAVAEAEAKRLNDIAVAAERSARVSWQSISPTQQVYIRAEREYQAVCELYAEKKASYDASIHSISAAENLIFAKHECVEEAKKNLSAEKKKIPALREQLSAALALYKYALVLYERLKNSTMGNGTDPDPTMMPSNALGVNSMSQLQQLLARMNEQARRVQQPAQQPARQPTRSTWNFFPRMPQAQRPQETTTYATCEDGM